MKGIAASTVDEYIALVPDDQRPTLEKLRELIRSLAPEAVESISYGLPTYKLNGKPLVYFGTAKKHYALYAISSAIREIYKGDLACYEMSKGTIRFPFDKPFPAALIKKLVKAQLAERKAGGKNKV
jgi:uncharacterized protein YdhG (YjbR/CyaY superfamily)